MASKNFSKQDPDYDEVVATPESSRRRDEENSKREDSIKKIRGILERHFNGEIKAKEEEVIDIEKKISETRTLLDQLRAYLLANYYGCNGKMIKGKTYEKKRRKRDDIKFKKKYSHENQNTTEGEIEAEINLSNDQSGMKDSQKQRDQNEQVPQFPRNDVKNSAGLKSETTINDFTSVNRFYVTRNIIVGNISKFIPLEKRDKNDQATHKWMVYVRASPGDPDISTFIQRVWFILHPSYMPNDMIEVARPPFTVTRRGWGEFPVRIQLVFHDPRNKPVDIIHNLKLDKTYTGLQTLGEETKIAIEMQRHTVGEKVEKDTLTTNLKETKVTVDRTSCFSNDGDASRKVSAPTNFPTATIKTEKEPEKVFENSVVKSSTLNEDMFIPKKVIELRKDILGEKVEGKLWSGASSVTSDTFLSLSGPNSRISSPVPPTFGEDTVQFDYFVEEALIKNIGRFPLICATRDITKLHYCAKSMEQYCGWSFSKRRACEWQRALDVKRFVLKTGVCDVITTKSIMKWCRKHGYTPAENKTLVVRLDIVDYCPKCGKCFPDSTNDKYADPEIVNKWCSNCLSDLNIKNTSTLTSFDELLCDISTQEDKLSNLMELNDISEDSDGSIIDVVGLGKGESEKIVRPLIDINELDPKAPSLLTDWIFEAAAQIEVDLKSVNVNGRKVPVLQQLLLEAMKSFIRDILTQSYAHSKNFQSNLDPIVVTPTHVLQALQSITQMDFLTNKFFGIQEEDGNV